MDNLKDSLHFSGTAFLSIPIRDDWKAYDKEYRALVQKYFEGDEKDGMVLIPAHATFLFKEKLIILNKKHIDAIKFRDEQLESILN